MEEYENRPIYIRTDNMKIRLFLIFFLSISEDAITDRSIKICDADRTCLDRDRSHQLWHVLLMLPNET